MKPGIIPIAKLSGDERDRVIRWARLNNIDPNIVPIESIIKITGNRAIVTELVFDRRRSGGVNNRVIRADFGLRCATRERPHRIRYDLKDVK